MGWRNLSSNNVFIGNFFFVAGIGMVVSAQWELVLANSYGYTVLSAFGLFYAGFGAIVTPAFGVAAAYGDDTTSYNNALGFWVLSKSAFPAIDNQLIFASVGSMEPVFSDWIVASEPGVHWHLFLCATGVHVNSRIVFCRSRRAPSRICGTEASRRNLCLSRRLAWLLYCR